MTELSHICHTLGCSIKQRKSEESQYREALQQYWSHPTLREEIWYHIHPHDDPAITIPMYLHYIEGWSRRRMEEEFNITSPTFYRWVTQLQVPARHREKLMAALIDISPVDEDLYDEAMENDGQWRVQGKTREYPPSKKLAMQLNRDMRRTGIVRVGDYKAQNRMRLEYQIKHHALSRGWAEKKRGVYHNPKEKRMVFRTMKDTD